MNRELTSKEENKIETIFNIIKKVDLKLFKPYSNKTATLAHFVTFFKNIKQESEKNRICDEIRDYYMADPKLSLSQRIDIEIFILYMNGNEDPNQKVIRFNVILKEFLAVSDGQAFSICFSDCEYNFIYHKIDNENYIFTSTSNKFPTMRFSCSLLRELSLIRCYHSKSKEENLKRIVSRYELIRSLNSIILDHLNTLNIDNFSSIEIINSNGKSHSRISIK